METITILKTLKDRVVRRLSDFVVSVTGVQDKTILTLDGYFTQEGASIYAHYEPMGLVAGSQHPRPETAKTKAILRLMQMLELRLGRCRDDDQNYDALFVKEVPENAKTQFIEYAGQQKLLLDSIAMKEGMFPVLIEEIVHQDAKSIRMRHIFHSHSKDLQEIWAVAQEDYEELQRETADALSPSDGQDIQVDKEEMSVADSFTVKFPAPTHILASEPIRRQSMGNIRSPR